MAYRILNYNSKRPIFISCEHASKKIPRKYGYFGIKKKEITKNSNYYDIGAEELSRMLAKKFKSKCILSNYSRFLINLNKSPYDPLIILSYSFGSTITGNLNLTKKEKKYRVKKYYLPYHERVKKEIYELKRKNKKIHYICIHSFSNKIPGEERKTDIGILYKYKKDLGFCRNVKRAIEEKTDLCVKFNHPYSAKKTAGYVMNKYGKSNKITCIEFEINDKHLRGHNSIKSIGNLLSDALVPFIH